MASEHAMAIPHRIWHYRLSAIATLFGLAGIFLPFTDFFSPVSAWNALVTTSWVIGEVWIGVGVAGLLVALWLDARLLWHGEITFVERVFAYTVAVVSACFSSLPLAAWSSTALFATANLLNAALLLSAICGGAFVVTSKRSRLRSAYAPLVAGATAFLLPLIAFSGMTSVLLIGAISLWIAAATFLVQVVIVTRDSFESS